MRAADSPFWQARAGALGETVSGLGDLDQSIRTVLTTPPGSVPLEPGFGCALADHMDRPAPQAAPAIVRAVSKALARWEPRVAVGSVDASWSDGGALRVSVSWRPSDAGRDVHTLTEVRWA